jgi:hypothetical protein
MISSLTMLRLIEMNRKDSSSVDTYVAGLLQRGIDDAIAMTRPWVVIHAPLWCLELLRKRADEWGFNFKADYSNHATYIKEVIMTVKSEITKQHLEDLAAPVGRESVEKEVTV